METSITLMDEKRLLKKYNIKVKQNNGQIYYKYLSSLISFFYFSLIISLTREKTIRYILNVILYKL